MHIYIILAWVQACEIHNNPEFLIFPCSNANVVESSRKAQQIRSSVQEAARWSSPIRGTVDGSEIPNNHRLDGAKTL